MTCLIKIVTSFFSIALDLNISRRLLILFINLFRYNLNSFNYIFHLIRRFLLRRLPFRRLLLGTFLTSDHFSSFFVLLWLRLNYFIFFWVLILKKGDT